MRTLFIGTCCTIGAFGCTSEPFVATEAGSDPTPTPSSAPAADSAQPPLEPGETSPTGDAGSDSTGPSAEAVDAALAPPAEAGTSAEAVPEAGQHTDAGVTGACAEQETLLCEDFEQPLTGHTQKGNVAIDEMARTGQGALRASTQETGDVAWVWHPFDAVSSGPLYARAHYFIPEGSSAKHVQLIDFGNCTVVASANSGIYCNAQARYAGSKESLPVGRWFCLQWEQPVGANVNTRLIIDGEVIATLEDVDTSRPEGISAVGFPATYTGESQGPITIYVDDLVVAKQPLACD